MLNSEFDQLKHNIYSGKFQCINKFIAFIFAITMFSCHENIPEVKSPANYDVNNYSDVFESFWTGMNTNYVFWDIDRTNWDSVHVLYQPLFASLGEFNSTNDAQARQYFTDMTANLIDSHYTLTFASGQQISPSLNRKLAINKLYPDSIYSLPATFFANVVNKNYLDPSTLVTGTDTILVDGSKVALTITSARLSGDHTILYLRLSDFFLSEAVKSKPALNYFFTDIVSSYSMLKGIVIDLRENGGGETTDITQLAGSLTTSTYTYGYTHSKSSVGRLDFTPWLPAVIRPLGVVNFEKPIAVLADHLSVSAAEITSLAIRAIPGGYGKIIGTTTWGANGPLAQNEFLNGGQFTVGAGTTFGPKGYVFVYTSSASFKAVDGTTFEERGISPDRWVAETSAAYHNNQDSQLEEAVNYINGR